MLTRQAAAAVSVGTYWPWETTAMLRLLGGARRFGAHRGMRGAAAYRGSCAPTACWVCRTLHIMQLSVHHSSKQRNCIAASIYTPVSLTRPLSHSLFQIGFWVHLNTQPWSEIDVEAKLTFPRFCSCVGSVFRCAIRWVWMHRFVSRSISTCSRRHHISSTTLSSRSTRWWSVTRIRGFLPREHSGICSTASCIRLPPAAGQTGRPVHDPTDLPRPPRASGVLSPGQFRVVAFSPVSTFYYAIKVELVRGMQRWSKLSRLIDFPVWCLFVCRHIPGCTGICSFVMHPWARGTLQA